MIVAFSGVKFSGKDTTAQGLIDRHRFKRIGLADKLKDICSEIFDIPRIDMDDPSKKESEFNTNISLNTIHIDTLLRILQRDGYDFDFTSKFETITKNHIGTHLKSIRDVLQFIGTDVCRNYIKDDIWLEYIRDNIKNSDGDIVITDARFRNEREYLRELGAILILVKRPGYEGTSTHISENQLGSEDDYDVIVSNESTITSVQSDISMWYTLVKDAATSYKSRQK